MQTLSSKIFQVPIEEKIKTGYYFVKPVLPTKENKESGSFLKSTEKWIELENLFKKEVIEAVGLKNHPKAEEICSIVFSISNNKLDQFILFKKLANLVL